MPATIVLGGPPPTRPAGSATPARRVQRPSTTVAVAAAGRLWAGALGRSLDTHHGIEVRDVGHLPEHVHRWFGYDTSAAPDVLVLEMDLGGPAGALDLLADLPWDRWPSTAAVLLLPADVPASRDILFEVGQALQIGGQVGFVTDDEPPDGLADAVRAAARGVLPMDADTSARALRAYGALPTVPLTTRQQQVVQGIADGLSNSQIAERLGVSPNTVKDHLREVYAKLGAVSRDDLAAMAPKVLRAT